MSKEKPTLRAQACRFQLGSSYKNVGEWQPGIAFLQSFDVSDVSFIIDAKGKKISRIALYDYKLLQLRTDGYIAIEPGNYAGKRYRPPTDES